MTGLAGFDFEFLNRRFRNDVFNQPVNLAERYGVSAERIRQIESGAIRKLRGQMSAEA